MSEHESHEQTHPHHPELNERGAGSTPPGKAEPILARETYDEAVVNNAQMGDEHQQAEAIPHSHSRIEERYNQSRAEFERSFLETRMTATDTWARERIFEQAEPNYRAGFIAGNDLRYDNQTFEEIEADLRREYLSSTAASAETATSGQSGDHWAQLREEIRAGFTKARAAR